MSAATGKQRKPQELRKFGAAERRWEARQRFLILVIRRSRLPHLSDPSVLDDPRGSRFAKGWLESAATEANRWELRRRPCPGRTFVDDTFA